MIKSGPSYFITTYQVRVGCSTFMLQIQALHFEEFDRILGTNNNQYCEAFNMTLYIEYLSDELEISQIEGLKLGGS